MRKYPQWLYTIYAIIGAFIITAVLRSAEFLEFIKKVNFWGLFIIVFLFSSVVGYYLRRLIEMEKELEKYKEEEAIKKYHKLIGKEKEDK